MIKKEVTYLEYDGKTDTEVERTETVRFAYTLPAVRLYETENEGRFWFDDLNKATEAMSLTLGGMDMKNIESADTNDQMKLMPLMSNPDIGQFMIRAIPCLYAEPQDGVLMQTQETHDNACASMWMMSLTDVLFFVELFAEITAGSARVPKSKKKVKGS
jgi:hypothetical protein